MNEYDAFGRRIDEDPLADQGWRGEQEAPAHEPAPAEQQAQPAAHDQQYEQQQYEQQQYAQQQYEQQQYAQQHYEQQQQQYEQQQYAQQYHEQPPAEPQQPDPYGYQQEPAPPQPAAAPPMPQPGYAQPHAPMPPAGAPPMPPGGAPPMPPNVPHASMGGHRPGKHGGYRAPAVSGRTIRRGAGAVLFTIFLFIAAIGVGGFFVVSALVDEVDDNVNIVDQAIQDIEDDIEDQVQQGVPVTPGVDADDVPGAPAINPPKGLEDESLVRRANFTKALGEMRRERADNLLTLRVAPDRIDFQAQQGNRMRIMQKSFDGALRTITTTNSTPTGAPRIRLSDVDPRAPERLARSAARRLGGKSIDRLDYLVLIDLGGQLTWGAFFKNGAHFQGNAQGVITQRVS